MWADNVRRDFAGSPSSTLLILEGGAHFANRKKQQFGQVALNALRLVGATALMVDISLHKLLVKLSDAMCYWTGTFMFTDLFPVN